MTNSIALLHAAERGDGVEVARLAGELARGVLAAEPVRLAFEVMAGGPHVVAKAIELAGVVAREARAGEDDGRETG